MDMMMLVWNTMKMVDAFQDVHIRELHWPKKNN